MDMGGKYRPNACDNMMWAVSGLMLNGGMWAMTVYTLFHGIYRMVRHVFRSTGHINLIRMLLGPIAGRFMFRMAPVTNGTFNLNGHTMALAGGGRYPPIDMAMGRYEEQTVNLLKSRVDPGMGMVDIGAHVGYFTLLGANLVGPEGRVYAFEAEPQNFSLLVSNIKRNGYHNIVPEEQSVSDECGTTQLFLSGLDNGSHSIFRARERRIIGDVQVKTTTLDAFLEARDWPRIDLIKIDVEGAEIQVLQGMKRLLQLQPPELVIEFCPFLLESAGKQPIDLINEIRNQGYHIEYVDEAKGIVPLAPEDEGPLIGSLLKHQTYVNIFCSKKECQGSAS